MNNSHDAVFIEQQNEQYHERWSEQMAEWQTCYEGCRCSECRQRRSDYFYMNEFRANRGIEYEQPIDPEYIRLNDAMDNLDYSSTVKKALRKKYLFE